MFLLSGSATVHSSGDWLVLEYRPLCFKGETIIATNLFIYVIIIRSCQ